MIPDAAAFAINAWSKALHDRTFETFVPLPSNSEAYLLTRLAASTPDFGLGIVIAGSRGLGGTHLTRAVGNVFLDRGYGDVVHLSAEEYFNGYFRSLHLESRSAFRERMHSCALLVIDDLQFLSDKRAAQIELLNQLEALGEASRSVIITVDELPARLPGLASELRRHLSRYMLAELHALTVDDRRQLIKVLSRRLGLELNEGAIRFLGAMICGNVRRVENVLYILRTFTEQSGCAVDMELIRKVYQRYKPYCIFGNGYV